MCLFMVLGVMSGCWVKQDEIGDIYKLMLINY